MNASRESIERFVSGRTMALAGVSASGRGFGAAAYKDLKARGYKVLAVHPSAGGIQGDPCWKTLGGLPERTERLLVCVKPEKAASVVGDAAAAGVRQIWFQQGAESADALDACREHGIEAIQGHCILMFVEPVTSIHKFHRWLLKVIGRLPG